MNLIGRTRMKLSELARLAEPEGTTEPLHFSGGNADPEIVAITSGSRKVVPGALFVALKGTADDGARFIPSALEAGASAVLTHSGASAGKVGVPVLKLSDPRKALSMLAAALYPR